MAITFARLNPIIFKETTVFSVELPFVPFYQKWNREDYIIFQIAYDKGYTSGEVIAKLVDKSGVEVTDCQYEVIETPNLFLSVFRVGCNVEDGLFRIKLTTKTDKFTFFSNYFEIGNHDATMLIEYGCMVNKFDCIFNTSDYLYRFYIRIDGCVKTNHVSFNADDVFYFSSDGGVFLVDSIPYILRKYAFGDGYGLPVWIADRLNRIFACDEILIDGVPVVKNDGGKLEVTASNNYTCIGLKGKKENSFCGDSEFLYCDEVEMIQAGVSVELIDCEQLYSVRGSKTGRVHIDTFEKTFN